MKIEDIWLELESDNSFRTGILFKRYSPSVLPDIYVALRAPEKLRCIAAHISRDNEPDVHNWNRLRDIKVEILPDDKDPSKSYLLFILLNNKHKDVFSVLSEDLIQNISQIVSETQVIKDLLNRLTKWQTLFEKLSQPGLAPESQRGLYGELFFLRKLLQREQNNNQCLKSWQVPSNKVQDFHHGEWAVEVKTTHSNNHQKIHISSERQLDTTIVTNLFLYHLSLDIRSDHGETLNQIVEWIENYLSEDALAFNLFKLKLFEVGYFALHKDIYEDSAYNIRHESIFRVIGDFPRISESQIRRGVGDVRYSIVISECSSYTVKEDELFNFITGKK